MAARSPRVAIVGGGIAGLTASLALGRAGLEADVYEQAREFTEAGAGLALGPNAIRLLRRLGLGEALDAISARPSGYEMRRWHDGRVIVETHRSGPLREMRSLTVHRGQLLQVLLDALAPERLHPGRRCVEVGQDPAAAEVRFEDGSSAEADVVVGADGIHSTVRSMHHRDRPVFSGQIAYRGLIPLERLTFLGGERDRITFWLGPRRHFLTYPIGRDAWLNLVAFVPADGTWAVESWTAEGGVAELAQHFRGWEDVVQAILGALDRTMRWALYDREPLPRWSFGRTTLLGDAAHAMLPHQGQGAGQSIEDAVVLARCLAEARPETVAQWLGTYEAIRKPRTRRVQQASRAAGEIYDLADPVEQERRAPSALETRGEWLWNYDADRAFEEAVRGGAARLPGNERIAGT